MSRKFWYGLSLWFCIYNLKLLYDNKYIVAYYLKKDNTDRKIDEKGTMSFFVCLDFDKIRNLDETDKNPNKEIVNVNEFIQYAKDKILQNRPKIVISKNVSKHFIYKKHYCFPIFNDSYKREAFIHFIENGFKLFAYSTERLPFFFESVYNRDFVNVSSNLFSFRILKQIVEEKERPYSKCLIQRKNKANEKPVLYDKLGCINYCLRFRFKYNSTYLFYEADETEAYIELAHISKNFIRKFEDDELCLEQIIKSIESCNLNECAGKYSFLIYFLIINNNFLILIS